jgi:hypothetical protein
VAYGRDAAGGFDTCVLFPEPKVIDHFFRQELRVSDVPVGFLDFNDEVTLQVLFARVRQRCRAGCEEPSCEHR